MSEHLTPDTSAEDLNPDPRSLSTLVVGAVGVLLTLATFIGLEVVYHRTAGAEFKRKQVESVSEDLEAARAEQIRLLEGYRWIDKAAGTVTLPIDRAMDLIVEEHAP